MTLTFEPVEGIGEVVAGDDIAELITDRAVLREGDIVVITSKIVSKAAGLTTTMPQGELLASQTDRIVARRGPTSIVRTHHGLVMAAAGIDHSNTSPGTLVPLPPDPDSSASGLRTRLHQLAGVKVAVIVSDTAGRAWREGQTDIAIGCAGLLPLQSYEGRTDRYGNTLAVTAPAIADQLAGGAELAAGKLGSRPVVIVRGADPEWLLVDDGPGARALVRDETTDMFGLGAREAAVAAVLSTAPVRGLPADVTVPVSDLVDIALEGLDSSRLNLRVDGTSVVIVAAHRDQVVAGIAAQRVRSLGIAYGVAIAVRVANAE